MSGACAVCGSRDLVLHLKVRHSENAALVPTVDRYGFAPADLVRCPACTHIQVQEFPSEDSLSAAYEEAVDYLYAHEELGQRATAAVALDRIERHSRVGSLCDLGCWMGFLVSEAERRGWRAVGIEPSRFASEFAREQVGVHVVTGTFDSVGQGEAYHAIVLADVIEHVISPGETLDRVAARLAPGGVVYLALPDAGSRIARMLGARWWSVLPTHLQYFTRASATRLLERHGYSVEWTGTAPKTFTARYYLERLRGYSPPLARALVGAATRLGLADRLVTPDFRDRMAVLARAPGGV